MYNVRTGIIAGCILSISACTVREGGSNYRFIVPPYNGEPYVGSMYMNQSDYLYQFDRRYYGDSMGPNYKEVYRGDYTTNQEVPDSYYTGSARAPVSFKHTDKHWVKSQNPARYTIQVADDEKPSTVAGKLVKVPKTDRSAEVKYQKDGKDHYKGLYGTYDNQEDAQKAMDTLPADVKQGASVKDWGQVQEGLVE